MRFVPTKTPAQQSCLMLHRTRHLFIRQQTTVINSIRAHLAEFGIVAPVGRKGVTELLHIVADPSDKRVPEVARACLAALGNQLLSLKEQIVEFDRMIIEIGIRFSGSITLLMRTVFPDFEGPDTEMIIF